MFDKAIINIFKNSSKVGLVLTISMIMAIGFFVLFAYLSTKLKARIKTPSDVQLCSDDCNFTYEKYEKINTSISNCLYITGGTIFILCVIIIMYNHYRKLIKGVSFETSQPIRSSTPSTSSSRSTPPSTSSSRSTPPSSSFRPIPSSTSSFRPIPSSSSIEKLFKSSQQSQPQQQQQETSSRISPLSQISQQEYTPPSKTYSPRTFTEPVVTSVKKQVRSIFKSSPVQTPKPEYQNYGTNTSYLNEYFPSTQPLIPFKKNTLSSTQKLIPTKKNISTSTQALIPSKKNISTSTQPLTQSKNISTSTQALTQSKNISTSTQSLTQPLTQSKNISTSTQSLIPSKNISTSTQSLTQPLTQSKNISTSTQSLTTNILNPTNTTQSNTSSNYHSFSQSSNDQSNSSTNDQPINIDNQFHLLQLQVQTPQPQTSNLKPLFKKS
jgi:hypothetical protein